MSFGKFVGFIALVGYSLVGLCDELTPEKKQNIEKLLTYSYTSGAGADGVTHASKQIFLDMKRQHTQLVEAPATEFIKKQLIAQLVEASIPVYHKYLTNQEIKDTLTFYTSASGKNFFAVFPSILLETNQFNQSLFQTAPPKITTAMIKEGMLPDPNKNKLRLDDPFGAPPKAVAGSCGPEQRYKFIYRIQSQEEFIRFLKTNLEKFKDRGNSSVLLDNYKESMPGMTVQQAPVDWEKVAKVTTTEKVGDRTIYKFEYKPLSCGNQNSTFKMTDDGHVSVYGCCTK